MVVYGLGKFSSKVRLNYWKSILRKREDISGNYWGSVERITLKGGPLRVINVHNGPAPLNEDIIKYTLKTKMQ